MTQPQEQHTNGATTSFRPSIPMYYTFAIGSYKNYAFGLEKMDHIFPDVQDMLYDHWRETESGYIDTPPSFNLDYFRRMEASAQWLVFTVRTADEIVGYASFFLQPDPHILHKFEALEHMIYLKPEHRKGYLASNLLKYTERHLPKLGVHQIEMVNKAPAGGPDIDKFLKANGFKQTAVHYTKSIKGEDHGR